MIKNSVPTDAAVLCRVFEGAVCAAQPAACMGGALAAVGSRGPALVLGAGKAAASSALAFCEHWGEPVRGMVVTRYGHGLAADEAAGAIEVIEAGHPSPDSASLRAGQQLLSLAASLRKDEQLFMLVSGGGSALAAAALAPLTFDQKRDAADFLIRSGADIREINCVRKHLSGLKGGRLARIAHPNPVITLAISDVPGDNVADIASGPTIADPTTQAEALDVLRKYAYPKLSVLERALRDPALETPGPEDPAFAGDSSFLIAKAATALDAAQEILADEGYEVIFLGDDLDAEADKLGREHAEIALRYRLTGRRIAILSGGETRVVIKQSGGRGGRNLEYLAGFALGLGDVDGISALAADTDGIDGVGGHAGGFLLPGMLSAGADSARLLAQKLAANDCYGFFEASDSLLVTGPTRTNVNDFRLILCEP